MAVRGRCSADVEVSAMVEAWRLCCAAGVGAVLQKRRLEAPGPMSPHVDTLVLVVAIKLAVLKVEDGVARARSGRMITGGTGGGSPEREAGVDTADRGLLQSSGTDG